MDRQAIRESIPDECPVDLDHARLHLTKAVEAAGAGDVDQMRHDADLAARILLCVARGLA